MIQRERVASVHRTTAILAERLYWRLRSEGVVALDSDDVSMLRGLHGSIGDLLAEWESSNRLDPLGAVVENAVREGVREGVKVAVRALKEST